jgi:hypothetical protein
MASARYAAIATPTSIESFESFMIQEWLPLFEGTDVGGEEVRMLGTQQIALQEPPVEMEWRESDGQYFQKFKLRIAMP